MKQTRQSITKTVSLKPEVEFEVIKTVLLRERYLKRLQEKLRAAGGRVDLGIIGAFDVLREATIEAVETIDMWEKTQVDLSNIKPFMWNGVNYLMKMTADGGDAPFLAEYDEVAAWLGFAPHEMNPFLVPTELYNEEFAMNPSSYLVFGQRPEKPQQKLAPKRKKRTYMKSPYQTPLYNDLQGKRKEFLNKALRAAEKGSAMQIAAADGSKEADADPYETFLSAENVKRIRRCWKILLRANPDLRFVYSSSMMFSTSFEPSVQTIGNEELFNAPSVISTGEGLEPSARSMMMSGVGETIGFTGNNNTNSSTMNGSVLSSSLHETEVVSKLENKAMRVVDLQFAESINEVYDEKANITDASGLIPMDRTKGAKVWAPHEIKLQTTVHKRGGELYVITAAGTAGRMKAPTRKSRFERIKSDIDHMSQQENRLDMHLEEFSSQIRTSLDKIAPTTAAAKPVGPYNEYRPETAGLSEEVVSAIKERISKLQKDADAVSEVKKNIHSHRHMLEYAYERYKKIMIGDGTGPETLKRLKKLKNNEIPEVDESVAQRLEYESANKIQSMVRRKIAYKIRQRMIVRRDKAVRKIQNCFRQHSSRQRYADQMTQVHKARIINKISTAVVGRGRFYILKRDALQDRAILCIQRSIRGMIARAKMKRKRLFIKSMKNAQDSVQPNRLTPRSIDFLASYIESYMSDSSIYVPIELMTLLRTILFMLNGSTPEVLDVIIAKKVYPENAFAESLSWMQALKVLRRKARLLRRMRSLAERVHTPNAVRLNFDEACVKHLSEAMVTLNERVFSYLPLNIRGTVYLLLEFVVNIERIFRMQSLFPEYFGCSQPGWFKKLLTLRLAHELNLIQYRVTASSSEILEKEREEKINSGKKFGHYANAFKNIAITLQLAEDTVKASGKKLIRFLTQLDQSEKKKQHTLVELEKSRVLGFTIAKREFETYMGLPGTLDESVISNMTFDIDDKRLGLLDCRVRVIKCNRLIDQDKATRSFEDMLSFDEIFEMEADISVIVARLLVLKEALDEFLFQIGGVQFIADLRGEEKDQYYALKEEVMSCIQRRRKLVAKVDRHIKKQFGVIRVTKESERYEYYQSHQEWDVPEDIESEAEKEENYTCAVRDLEKRSRQSLTPNRFVLEARNDVSTVLILIDGFVPRRTLENVIRNLTALHFEHYSVDTSVTEVYKLAQATLAKGKNVVITVNRGIHAMARVYFDSSFFTLKHALSPSPRVCLVDGYDVFRCLDWISEVSTSMEVLSVGDVEGAYQCVVNKGRLKHLAEIFKLSSDTTHENNVFATFVPMEFRQRISQDTTDYLNLVRTYIAEVEMIGCEVALSRFDSFESKQRYAFLLLAAGMGSVFALWKPSRIVEVWPPTDVLLGAKAFVEFCPTVEKVSDLLENHPLIATSTMMHAFIMGASSLTVGWDFIRSTYDYYRNPCIQILYQYYNRAIEFLLITSKAGGIPSIEAADAIDVAVTLDWNRDVLSDTKSKRITGDILSIALQHSIIYETQGSVALYNGKSDIFDVKECVTQRHQSFHDVKIYHQCENVYFSVTIPDGRGSDLFLFGHATQDEVFDAFQPNGVETFESRIPLFEFGAGHPTWFQRIVEWIRLQSLNASDTSPIDDSSAHLVRSRYMLHSMIGTLNGYQCRIEVYEEAYGNIVYLIYGLPCGMRLLRFNKSEYKTMSDNGDPIEERTSFDSVDVHRVAVLMGDRMRVTPSANMHAFLEDSALCPGQRNLLEHKIFFHMRGGPGRKLGSKFVKYEDQEFWITLIEIHNESDSYTLRILVYNQKTSKTVEYRLSPLERVLLFYGRSEHLLDDIISRFKIVRVSKKELDDEKNGLIPLAEDIAWKGQLKYESQYTQPEVNDDDDESADLAGRSLVLYRVPDRTFRVVSEILPSGEEIFNRVFEDHDPVPIADSDVVFALHFDRSGASRTVGNIKISIALHLSREGFLFTIFDKIRRFMNYTFVSFTDIHRAMGQTMASFMRTIDKLDDADVVTELFDEILKLVRQGAAPNLPQLSRFVVSSADRQEIIPLSFCEVADIERPQSASSQSSQELSRPSSAESRSGLTQPTTQTKVEEIPITAWSQDNSRPSSAESRPGTEPSGPRTKRTERGMSASSMASQNFSRPSSADSRPGTDRPSIQMTNYVKSIGRRKNYGFVRYSSPVANLLNCSESGDVEEGASYKREYFDPTELRDNVSTASSSQSQKVRSKRNSMVNVYQAKLQAMNSSNEAATVKVEKLDTRPIVVQPSFVYEHVVVTETEDPSRICWRGKLYLKDVESTDKVVLKRPMQRALKLTNWVQINDVKAVDVIQEIFENEMRDEDELNLLPIVVKEILSEGPGVATRKFRIEMFSANKISMGYADIANEEDLRRIVGNSHLFLVEADDSQRDVYAIFSHIVNHRLTLNMLSLSIQNGRRTGRRNAISKAKSDGASVSLITLKRDDFVVQDTDQKDMQSDSGSDSGDEDREEEEEFFGDRPGRVWLRLLSRRHTMSGRGVRTMVMLEGDVKQMYERPDIYFQRASAEERLMSLDVCFKTMDLYTKVTHVLRMTGPQILAWLPADYTVDLSSRFRRAHLGSYLIENLRLRYTILGDFYLSLFNMH